MKKVEPSHIAGGILTAPFETRLAVLQRVERGGTVCPRKSTLHTPKRHKNMRPHKILYVSVYKSMIHYSPDTEATQISTNWRTEEGNMGCPHNGIL